MTRVVVCDTRPLLHLSEAGAVDLLTLTGEILIPPLVADEYKANPQGWLPPQWARVVKLRSLARQKAREWTQARRIDGGEAEAIALAIQEIADWLLTDDAQARQFAESLGLEVHGSLGVLLWNVAAENITDKAQALRLLDNLA